MAVSERQGRRWHRHARTKARRFAGQEQMRTHQARDTFASSGHAHNKKERSCAPCTQQGSLHCILVQCPTTAGSAQFCLLCCQPEPVPGSLAVRMSLLSQRDPYRLPAWLGRTINMLYKTCCAPAHSIVQSRGNRGEDIRHVFVICFNDIKTKTWKS